ncbi:MAG: phage protease, partial [Burkholderiales bacterium]|nr:phage protease [Burkholderiales bacterium]
MRNRNRLAFCAVLAALNVGATEIQLLPAGEFRGIDGRPSEVHSWRVTAEIAERLRATLAARVNPLPVDYEHQTLRSVENGQPAPAAGWLKAVEWRDGLGLFGVVEWTERARALIAAGEYRYISPVFRYDAATGEPLELLPPALVNYPAIDGMQAVALSALAEAWSGSPSQQEITTMNELLKAVLKALGLKDDATPEAATA